MIGLFICMGFLVLLGAASLIYFLVAYTALIFAICRTYRYLRRLYIRIDLYNRERIDAVVD
jgi:hypothetical protein